MKNLSLLQKILFITLGILIALMVIFSFASLRNRGKAGYDKCIQEKCEDGGQEYCEKFREINNCCLGTGGKVANSGGKAVCVFE